MAAALEKDLEAIEAFVTAMPGLYEKAERPFLMRSGKGVQKTTKTVLAPEGKYLRVVRDSWTWKQSSKSGAEYTFEFGTWGRHGERGLALTPDDPEIPAYGCGLPTEPEMAQQLGEKVRFSGSLDSMVAEGRVPGWPTQAEIAEEKAATAAAKAEAAAKKDQRRQEAACGSGQGESRNRERMLHSFSIALCARTINRIHACTH